MKLLCWKADIEVCDLAQVTVYYLDQDARVER